MTRIGIAPKTKSLLVPVYKPVGKTPLECVELYKSRYLNDPSTTVSYAGRLDPMAEGVLLLLVGDANARRREYEHLEKEYEVTVLVGFSTDTGDLMGKTMDGVKRKANGVLQRRMSLWLKRRKDEGLRRVTLEDGLHSFTGIIEQRYPVYSSAKVKGKPLYWWARQGRLDEIEIPTHMVKIDTIEIVSHHTMTAEALLKYIVETVGSVQGDFRQKEIIAGWKEALSDTSRAWIRQVPITSRMHDIVGTHHDTTTKNDTERTSYSAISLFTLRITCGSGTYMRQLVMDIGEKLNIPLCAFKIKRTRVGNYGSEDCEGIH